MDIAFDYDIEPRSVVIDLGGYKGDFAAWFRRKYPQTGIHVMEPVHSFWKECLLRFERDPLVWVYDFAAGSSNRQDTIHVKGDSSSLYGGGGEPEVVKVRDINQWALSFKLHEGLGELTLVKSNIESSEYEVFPHLIKTGWMPDKLKQIAIQLHPNPDFEEERHMIESCIEENYNTIHRCSHWWVAKLK